MDSARDSVVDQSLAGSISDHQLLAIKIVCRRLVVSTEQELEDKGLPQVYSELARVYPNDAGSYMYLMLKRVGVDENILKTLFNPPGLKEVHIGFQEDLVLTTASIVNSMKIGNNEEPFKSFRTKVKDKFFPHYNPETFQLQKNCLHASLIQRYRWKKNRNWKICAVAFQQNIARSLRNLADRHHRDITAWSELTSS